MSDASLLERLDRAIQHAYGEAVRRSDGEIASLDGFSLLIGNHPSPILANVAFRSPKTNSSTAVPNQTILERIADRYRSIGHGVSLMTSHHADPDVDDLAASSGWRMIVELPGMVLTSPVEPATTATPTTIDWLDAEDVDTFREVLAEGFAEDDDERAMIAAMFASSRSIAAPGVRAATAVVDGAPVACGSTYDHEGVAVVAWVATVPSRRMQGLGSLVTAALANAAFEHGADLVCLQASPMGFPVYQRMGFETVTTYRLWLPPEAEEG